MDPGDTFRTTIITLVFILVAVCMLAVMMCVDIYRNHRKAVLGAAAEAEAEAGADGPPINLDPGPGGGGRRVRTTSSSAAPETSI